ncbi:unnamed protein product [Timema podura]|uniref:ATPase AAA-type core domain-containing protein n=1 Tax=Timema podura TaxID=61482 RepID=A0ABN7NVL9_TIMPD|nr:unnamed protein product [Timema podura]
MFQSGKLVTQMFTLIRETIARNRDVLTCILIDEVESLTHIRQASESEPSDAIRVVNAVLTQIDQIRGRVQRMYLFTVSNDDTVLTSASMQAKLINNECLFPVDLLKYPEAQSGLSLHLKQIAG